MASSKHWSLYATSRRIGTHSEHRLAGVRLRAVGVTLDFSLPKGWEAIVHVGRFAATFKWAVGRGDPRLRDWFDFIMPPSAAEELTQAKADIAAGRGYRWKPNDDGRTVPLATWRPDDPEQPEGWHHDGRRWVLNDDGGWFQSRSGYWRYNKPGDPGWRELDDGSWRYDAAPVPTP